ncbi:hypothetical protein VE03_01400 [Pseudogymnoascus sp. 23342-1-I1]|nr:hypothetical protein VE03_01400 [Pseudogymnoascus sp. 23342-1-I1]
MLIDLDTAWDISRGPTPQGSMVGTAPFMAIGALQVRKTADMGEEGFKAILEEFSPEFEGLKGPGEKLRSLLFPLRDGKIWTWTDVTPEGTNQLYDDITGAFEDALPSVAKL